MAYTVHARYALLLHAYGGCEGCMREGYAGYQTRLYQRLVTISAVLDVYVAPSTRDIVQNYAVSSEL